MSTNAEITYAIQNDRPSITIRYSAQEEGNSKPDLCDILSQIQEAITKFQAKPHSKLLSNTEVVVHDVPHPAPATHKPQALPLADNNVKNSPQKISQKPNTNLSSSGKKKISESQIATIRQNLRERSIPECVFCNKHGIKRVEELPGGIAWHVIHDHLY